MKNLKVISKTIKLLGKHMGKSFMTLVYGYDIKSLVNKNKNKQVRIHQNKKLCAAKKIE